MKRLYLAASIDRTGAAIADDITKETGKLAKNIKTAFINTAAEGSTTPDRSWLTDDKSGLAKGGFNLFDYTITGKNKKDFDNDLGDCDVIHVNGGNSFYLLLQVRKTGFDDWIRKRVLEKNIIYIGSSAGSQILSPDLEVLNYSKYEDDAKKLKSFEGINLIDFIIFPHWGSEKFRDVYFDYRLKQAYKPENKIILLNNWQLVKVVDDKYSIIDVRD